ncbi:MAG TPA: hypothetical protein VGP94_16715 [Tepidisphaeraceae bacterium]|nr:hypothetical protein [Tepidisphaeraceae bacterium]
MRIWLAMALVVMVGCAQKPQEVVEEGEKSVNSWRKTLEMVCGQWAEYRVPTLYVRQTLKAAEEVLGKQLQELGKPGSDQDAQKVVRKIHRLRFWIEQHREELSGADAKKRKEILMALPSDAEGP